MKNFLIPTTLKDDTISAVKSAVNQAKDSQCEIILMIVSESRIVFHLPIFYAKCVQVLQEAKKKFWILVDIL